MVKDFKEFILQGNVVQLAVAVVIGIAFGAVIASFVEDLLTPLIAAIGGQPDFSTLDFEINGSVYRYGAFLNAVISFLIIAAVVYFLIVVPYTKAKERFFPAEEEGTPADIALLEQIRDLLAARGGTAV
jgi:large conductance mechanosensitive channel